jgi:hypothetical protein
VLLQGNCWAQKVSVTSSLDSGVIRIGEQTTIRLHVHNVIGRLGLKLTWPHLSDTLLKNIPIVHVSHIDTVPAVKDQKGPGDELVQSITITSFDSGYYAIPPFRFLLSGDTSNPLLTEAMLLRVVGMKVDTTIAIKDIKQPLGEPFSWRELLPYLKWAILGLVLFVGLILLIYYSPWKKKGPIKPNAPPIPPHRVALENLQKLQDKKLWQEGKLKEYHSELTEILRWFIEQRFHIPALEQTSDEIISTFRSIPVSVEGKAKLKQVLLLSDLVKFAKQQTLPEENLMSMDNAIAFVMESKEDPAPGSDPQTILN